MKPTSRRCRKVGVGHLVEQLVVQLERLNGCREPLKRRPTRYIRAAYSHRAVGWLWSMYHGTWSSLTTNWRPYQLADAATLSCRKRQAVQTRWARPAVWIDGARRLLLFSDQVIRASSLCSWTVDTHSICDFGTIMWNKVFAASCCECWNATDLECWAKFSRSGCSACPIARTTPDRLPKSRAAFHRSGIRIPNRSQPKTLLSSSPKHPQAGLRGQARPPRPQRRTGERAA